MASEQRSNVPFLVGLAVISVTVTGYFVGLQSPMNPADAPERSYRPAAGPPQVEAGAIPATHYADMSTATDEHARQWRTKISDLKRPEVEPEPELEITPALKADALADRDDNRAFNGAPPTIPHPVEGTAVEACMACHEEGALTESLQIPRMSHQFLTNCTQCHVESIPDRAEPALFRESGFIGLPAPDGGPRAFEEAPPQIPHTTWMREECMSCHGPAGREGIRTTHPERRSCQQCHAPSSILEQTRLVAEPRFLAPPTVE